jgi:hypothetical protein
MALKEIQKNGNYLSIIDGTLRRTVPEGTMGAIRREYETSDKKKGVKWELVYGSLTGKLTDVQFRSGDYGKQLSICIKDKENYYVSMPYKSRYAIDLMKKLPNIDLSKDIEIIPFDFKNEKDKTVKGITVMQDGEKIQNHFWNEVEKKENLHEFPQVEKDYQEMDSDDWQIYFTNVAKFLEGYVYVNVSSKLEKAENKVLNDYPAEEIDPEDIPF